jgi:hypothetical protein
MSACGAAAVISMPAPRARVVRGMTFIIGWTPE